MKRESVEKLLNGMKDIQQMFDGLNELGLECHDEPGLQNIIEVLLSECSVLEKDHEYMFPAIMDIRTDEDVHRATKLLMDYMTKREK